MIKTLHISNYALISGLDITFYPGLNIITGETGAGKSIMLGALSVLLGARADMKAIRDPERKSVIEAEFDISGYPGLREVFERSGLDWEGDTCILRRELSPAPSLRSRAFINDSVVTLPVLREVALRLVDIHSQHENQLLSDPQWQLEVIDSLAGADEIKTRYSAAFKEYRRAVNAYVKARNEINKNKADAEFLAFQLEQLDELKLKHGEQETLERDRDRQANMTGIKEHITDALRAFHDPQQGGVLSALARIQSALRHLGDVLPDEDTASRFEAAYIELQDIADNLSDFDNSLSADPAMLDYIEERLDKIYTLERRHGVETSDELLAVRDDISARLATIADADVTLGELQDAARRAKKEVLVVGRELSEARRRAADEFAAELVECAVPLGMKNLRFEIELTQGDPAPSGLDSANFLFSFNKNQALMPVGETASGGEISRLVLSIKAIVARRMALPTVIFDEVDTGVSGDVALRMAALMERIAEGSQVISITHLPQVAARGASHFKVYKEDDDKSTNTHIRVLSADERVGELALMLSGSATDAAAQATAKSLLGL